MLETEFLIVGGGIIGLTLAKVLIEQGAEKIILLEKESEVGLHASGRSSGVLHAGIYYPSHTLKAKLCLQGNLLLQQYCDKHRLPIKKTGKVIVARDDQEVSILTKLHDNAKLNGAEVRLVDEKELAKIEPFAQTVSKALYSSYTAIVETKAILRTLQLELQKSQRVQFLFNNRLEILKDEFTAVTTQHLIRFKQFINCAGAYADKVAHLFGVGKDYYLIPFKGIYQKLIKEKEHWVNGNIYPVPNLNNPFLGVHFTKSIYGDVYVGPTAIPAFGRENYGCLRGMNLELFKILWREMRLFCENREFRNVALEEPKKYLTSYFFKDAKKLVKELKPEWLIRTGKSGIRPQLVRMRDWKLVTDFLILKERHSLHVLNAISPAFTSSMAMAGYIVNEF